MTIRRIPAGSQLALLLTALTFAPAVIPAELTIADGVVVKFSDQSHLVVRDKLSVGTDAVLTSRKDASVGGATASADQLPAKGDWLGVHLEKSAVQYGVSLQGFTLRYAGGTDGAALSWRGFTLPLPNFFLQHNGTGLKLLDGASTTISGASFLGNDLAIELNGNSSATLSGSQFLQNVFAVQNNSPSIVTQASSNWWGHASGPKDIAGNPNGQGDAVSAGVNYASYLTSIPLINPSIRVAQAASYYDSHTLTIKLACTNATEYRLAESTNFSGVPFQLMTAATLATNFTFSANDGRKNLYVQYRNVTGETVTKALDGGALIDTQLPSVAVSNPAAGSVLSGTVQVEATVADGSGINVVNFYVNGVLKHVTALSPYKFEWNTDDLDEGDYTLRIVALDQAGRATAMERPVSIYRTPLSPDLQGPALGNVRLAGTVLTSGATLTGSATINVDAGDRSGVSRIDLLLDGIVVGTFAGAGSYAATLNLDFVTNGAHMLTLRATDSLNNVATATYDVTVAHAAPAAPVLQGIASGTVVRETSLALTGTAPAGTQVQLYINGSTAGTPIAVDGNGNFNAVAMLAEGSNEVRAKALSAYGESALSSALTVVRDTAVPLAPVNLAGISQPSGLVRLSWAVSSDPSTVGYHVYRASSAFTLAGEAFRINSALLTTTGFDDLPVQDGMYFYRIVAVNGAGTVSPASNMVQAVADKTAPRAFSVVYTSQGKVDAASGRIGQGRVAVSLNVSEALLTTPYLAVVPQGGQPLPVTLTRRNDTTYDGSFLVTTSTGSGIANALFSARDTLGNRGTVIDAGATLSIDTEGPALSAIAVAPVSPIRNENSPSLAVTFTLSDAVKSGTTPEFGWRLSGAGNTPQLLSGLTAVNATTWTGTLQLPANAGALAPETLTFTFNGSDDLDNVSDRVTAENVFQVYQGDLPPLNKPLQFLAKAAAGGKVNLSWQAVEGAVGYQLYRQAPGDTQFVALSRASDVAHVDQTPMDGTYRYAVATLREANGQESLSALSEGVEVVASATAPGVPENLQLTLTGRGIQMSWQPPLSSTVHSYRVYRADGAEIVSVDGLTPLRANIATPAFIDAVPSLTEHAYVVTALDAAGNESAISNGVYLNASLLPVPALRVERQNNNLPMLFWEASRTPVAGYNVYVGAETNRVKLTETPVTNFSFMDHSYTQGTRLYSVAAVDSNGVEIARDITLHDVSVELVSGLPVKRGIMNRLMVQVSNNTNTAVSGGRVVINVGGRNHVSDILNLTANETRLVPVVIGGYGDLPANAPARLAFEIVPNEGELLSLSANKSFDVTDSALIVGISTDDFTRGATGKVRITVENTSEVDVELLSARTIGAAASDELRFKLLDKDGNVLAVQPYKQVLGESVVTLSNGLTVTRIPAGAAFTSEPFTMPVPLSTPTQAYLRLDIDKLRYRSGEADEVLIGGRGAEALLNLVDTPYTAEVTDVTPVMSFGDQDIVISGTATDRLTQLPVPSTQVRLLVNQQGFERKLDMVTDENGQFSYVFTPGYADAGIYKVAAVHPAITDKPEQKAFTIQRVAVAPRLFKLTIPRNYSYSVPFTVSAGLGTSASNVRLVLDESTQPKPAGVSVTVPSPVSVVQRQTLNAPVLFTADNTAPASGTLTFKVYSDEQSVVPLGSVSVEFVLTEAKPYLAAIPSFVETGLAMGGSQMESVVLENKGLQDALDLQFSLTLPDGSPAPAWVALATNGNGTLKAGEKRTLDLGFTPPASLAAGIYEFRLKVQGINIPEQALNVFAAVTQSGEGNALFKVSDIYTATVDKNGNLIQGLTGAKIIVQNEDVLTVTQTVSTDAFGEAFFQNLPAGFYKFKASATNHQELNGRFQIKPGITASKPVFLDYNVVTVEWSVREITIQDRYEITLNATFETDVPTAVVLLEPMSINLPEMKVGEVYYGELSLTNYGLVRAENVKALLPTSDASFKYEFLAQVPDSLGAKSRIVIPYRVVSVAALENNGTGSGGGCINMGTYPVRAYFASARVNYDSKCANGQVTPGSTAASWYSLRWSQQGTTTCQVDSTVGGGPVGSVQFPNWSGGLLGGGTVQPTELSGQQDCQVCPDGNCDKGGSE